MTETALVTGGRGFLGSHLTRRLLEEGWEVHVSGRSPSRAAATEATYHECDPADMSAAAGLLDRVGPDVVFHLSGAVGARPDMSLVRPMLESHVLSAVNLMTLMAERPVRRLIVTGSLLELHGGAPTSPYNAAKAAARLYAEMFHALYGTPVVLLRPFMTFGPGQGEARVLPYAIRSLAAGESPALSSGVWRADWVYVGDVIEGFVRAATVPGVEGKSFDLGRGELVSLRDMVLRIASLMESSVAPGFGRLEDRPGEPEQAADTAAASAALGWSAETPLDEGLRRTIEYYT